MTSKQAYLKFTEKFNKNFTNNNISIDESRFVITFNESQNKYIEWVLKQKNNEEIRLIQKLVVYDKKLKASDKNTNFTSFWIPNNLFEFVDLQIVATKGNCKGEIIDAFEYKHGNLSELIKDEYNKPSFEYRETFYSIGEDKVNIFTNNEFTVDNLLLTYYRYPVQINLEGIRDIEGKMGINVDPEFDDKVIDKIITICVKETSLNNDDYNKASAEMSRIQQKI